MDEKELRKKVLDDIKEKAEDYDGYYSLTEYQKEGKYYTKIYDLFDNWTEAKLEAGLPSKGSDMKERHRQKLQELVEEGLTMYEMAEEIGISQSYVSQLLREMGYTPSKKSTPTTLGKDKDGKKYLLVHIPVEQAEKSGAESINGKYFYRVVDGEDGIVALDFKVGRYSR